MWPHEHGRKQLNGSISDFYLGTVQAAMGFAFIKQKYGCRASNFSNCALIVALLQKNVVDSIWLM